MFLRLNYNLLNVNKMIINWSSILKDKKMLTYTLLM